MGEEAAEAQKKSKVDGNDGGNDDDVAREGGG